MPKTKTYTYNTANKDRLVSVSDGSESFTIGNYDLCGNPCNYGGNVLEWSRGRLLTKFGNTAYGYTADGIRTEKSFADGRAHLYRLDGAKIVKELRGTTGEDVYPTFTATETLHYFYDAQGVRMIEYAGTNTALNGKKFLLQRNLQGDVVRIVDDFGVVYAKYEYDAWGNHKVYNASGVETTDASFIGNINPFRYRGYYYDTESGLYYLQTRYYDPKIGRFLNMDTVDYLDPGTLNGCNLYAYCNNNPVMYVDPTGHFAFFIITALIGAAIGGTIAGVTAYNNGARGWDLVGSIAGGAILGGGMGAIMAIGGAAGLASIGAGLTGFSLSAGAAFGVSLAVGAGAGLLSYTAETLISPSKQWSWAEFGKNGLSGLLKGAVTYRIAFLGAKFGAFDKVFLKDVLGKEVVKNIFSYDIAKGILASIIPSAGRQFFTQAAYYLGESLTKMFFVNSIAAGARWIIDKIFGT